MDGFFCVVMGCSTCDLALEGPTPPTLLVGNDHGVTRLDHLVKFLRDEDADLSRFRRGVEERNVIVSRIAIQGQPESSCPIQVGDRDLFVAALDEQKFQPARDRKRGV